jgi:hypothetical protein
MSNQHTRYAVELTAVPDEQTHTHAAQVLAAALDADPDRVHKLIAKAPKKISSAMSQADAEAMANICRDAGLDVSLIPIASKRSASAAPSPSTTQRPQPQRPQPQKSPAPSSPASSSDAKSQPATVSVSSASRSTVRPERNSAASNASVTVAGTTVTNPYVTVLFAPRKTMRHVLETSPVNSDLKIVVVLTLLGILPVFLFVTLLTLSIVSGIIFIAGITALISAVIALYINGFMYYFIGEKAFGGSASYAAARLAYAWGLIPAAWLAVILAVFLLPASVIFPPVLVSALAGVFVIVAALWSTVVQAQTLGEAHGISGWQGFGTILISGIILSLIGSILGAPLG